MSQYVIYVGFEGGEGAGKSVVIKQITSILISKGYAVKTVKEPGYTDIGKNIRQIVLDSLDLVIPPIVGMFLFSADRAALIEKVIKPLIYWAEETKQITIVISDRCSESARVYVQAEREYRTINDGITLEKLDLIADIAVQGIHPDHVILFDLPAETGLSRRTRGDYKDRIDQFTLEFHKLVRRLYLLRAEEKRKTWSIVDASSTVDKVTKEVLDVILGLIKRREAEIAKTENLV